MSSNLKKIKNLVGMNMELECAKYKEKMSSEEASCRHPGDYCKFRTSCIIYFMSSENGKKNIAKSEAPDDPAGRPATGKEL